MQYQEHTGLGTLERTVHAREEEHRRQVLRWRTLYRDARGKVASVLIKRVGSLALRLLGRSWRVTRRGYANYQQLKNGEDAFLVAPWHGRTLTFAPLHSHHGIHILVSPSRDGRMVGGLLERLGYGVIWGSSHRRAVGALREMLDHLQAGDIVGIMPDGPVGPRHSTHVGLPWLARETGLPIITGAVACDRGWRFNSWDRLLVPKIGARLVITYGEPLYVPPDTSNADLLAHADRIRERLIRDEEGGFRILGEAKDW